MAIEIVDFLIKNGGSFHSYVSVCQRVDHFKSVVMRIFAPMVDHLDHLWWMQPGGLSCAHGKVGQGLGCG
jgi:hypothetical protein